ncbi:hypothetical protein B0H14DRAFT_2659458 [Mycena olivaceomarginata]|nr:hypothetical protein B0H14DRAFT_2659458 [Mycena olivaceomarginata]
MDTGRGYGSQFQTRAQPVYPTRVPAGFWTFSIWPLRFHPISKLEYFRINKVSKTATSTVETKGIKPSRKITERRAVKTGTPPYRRRGWFNLQRHGDGTGEAVYA